jgi:hypothetical protein
MDAETWLTAEETVALGLADSIAPEKPKAQAKWDLSAFEALPSPQAQAAPEPAAAELDTPNKTLSTARANWRVRLLHEICRAQAAQSRRQPPLRQGQSQRRDDAASFKWSPPRMSIQALREQRAAKAKVAA